MALYIEIPLGSLSFYGIYNVCFCFFFSFTLFFIPLFLKVILSA